MNNNNSLKFPNGNPIKLHKDIYLYENFYKNSNIIEDNLIAMKEDQWNSHYNYHYNDHSNDIWFNRLSLDFVPREFHDSIINFVSPDYWTFSHGNFMRLKEGDTLPIHNNSLPDSIEYILSYYVGDFTGGQISFLENDITYQPKKNDLIVFKPCSLDISPVNSGTRYSYVDYILKHPGYVFV